MGLDPSACAPAGSSWGCWGTQTHESMRKHPLSGMYKCIPYSTGGKCCTIWPCPTARPRLIKQGCSGQGMSESLPTDRMQPGQISATLMSHSRKADAAQPEWARLSPPPLSEPWQAAATDCCSKGHVPCPPPLPSTALPWCGGGPRGSPQPQATPPQPGTLPAAPGTATASGSPARPRQLAAPEEPELQGQEQPSFVGDTGNPQLTGTLFGAGEMQPSPAQPLLAALPQHSSGAGPHPGALGRRGEPGPGNSTHHA